MTNPDYTAVMLLVDRSGSMATIQAAAEAGINELIAAQRVPGGKRTIRIAQFDTKYEVVCPSSDPAAIGSFSLSPRGGTALLDAMGRAILEFGEELAAMPEDDRPGIVIFAVQTDGEENSSREFTFPQIETMVNRQRDKFGWHILYLGANQDAIKVGERIGVRRDQSMTYTASDTGTRSMLSAVTRTIDDAASGVRPVFTDQQRKDATGR